MDTLSERRVSSPASTGGAGTFFEQHVAAYWLAQLLVRGIPPILLDCSVTEVHLQTVRLGWHTDDFLIVGQNGAGGRRKLAGQVKRTFAVSAANEECRKAIGDFWSDFTNDGRFSPETDRFALVTQRGTNVLLGDFAGLLDCARAVRSGADFAQRLATTGSVSKKAVGYCSELRAIVGDKKKRSVTEAEIWPFLRCLHVLSLDLQTSTRQNESEIKNLLALTTVDSDPGSVVEASWNALLAIAADGMGSARSFRRNDNDLDDLRQRHSVVGGPAHNALRALKEHTDVVWNGIRSTIGNEFHLPRAGLVQELLQRLESTQVVLASGPAGVGKSAVVRDAITVLRNDYFAFCFRAEEFAQPHLDTVLQNAQISANTAALKAILATQDRKVLVIESVERLLEKSTRDAFSDLIGLAAKDVTVRIMLTCRDYSTDLVRASFLESAPVEYSVVDVPQLDDDELTQVETSLPALSQPLANPTLCQVLRNPYVLDLALRISWSADRPLPESQREFRAVFWRQRVRADDRSAQGMPHRRDKTFGAIALHRARALAPYVTCDHLDPAVVQSLRQDSLIVSSDQSPTLVAPAHDVLEDWAVLRWIEQQSITNEGSFRALSEAIGTYPAVRRAYRIWVAELVDRDPDATDRLFKAAITEEGIAAQFRDDTLVSLLRAPSSPAFLERRVVDLLANDRDLLKRIIHLLRIACVRAPNSLPESAGQSSLFNVPDGPAWASVLRIVQTHVDAVTEAERLLLLGLVQDWAKGVSAWEPYPDGAESVAEITHRLLSDFDTYRPEGAGQQTLSVIAKIPKADVAGFEALLRGSENDRREPTVDTFRDIVFTGLEGMPAARDLPDLVVSVAADWLLCSEADLQRGMYRPRSLDLEILFGLKEHLSHKFFPASAHRGPWLALLQHHPDKGLNFLITVFNHSVDWYAHPRVADTVEPPFEIELTLATGTQRKQWANSRLWRWYRGTSVGPEILQSLLMALERWLFDLAEARSTELDATLLDLLRRSECAAVTAVVASVATAFPHLLAETLLVLLSSPMCIRLDRERMATESQSPPGSSNLLHKRGDNRIYEVERTEANSLAHRRSDLESAIVRLQSGPLANRVHALLDRHREALPPAAEQTDEDRLWRLSMHRMDLRRYSIARVVRTKTEDLTDGTSDKPAEQVRLDLDEPEPDVKRMVDESSVRVSVMDARLRLLMWALHVFKNEDVETWSPAEWRQRLGQARAQEIAGFCDDGLDMARGGPGIVAAVCVRDHWQEMSADEQNWCVEVVCSEIAGQGSVWTSIARIQRTEMSADRMCASVISVLVAKSLSVAQRSRVRQAFITALTHSVDQVRWYAACGVAKQLWPGDRELVMRCVNALATEATLVGRAQDAEAERAYDQRWQTDEVAAEAASVIREGFWHGGGIAADAYQRLNITERFGAEANGRILAILGRASTEPEAITAFTRTARTLVGWWNSDDGGDRENDRSRHARDHDTESMFSELLQNFVMRTSADAARRILQPLLEAVDSHPKEIHWVIRGLTVVEDRERNTARFWTVWELFADMVRCAGWLTRLDDDEHQDGIEMISAMFLGSWWEEGIRHWSSLEGHAHRVHVLFDDLPPSSVVLDAYVRFLYDIGEQSLPDAFVRVASRLQSGDTQQMLRKTNTVFMLEVLLQRQVYGRPLQLKRELPIRDAVLFLLDVLVEQGSSAAFRMRDDFVTPVSVA